MFFQNHHTINGNLQNFNLMTYHDRRIKTLQTSFYRVYICDTVLIAIKILWMWKWHERARNQDPHLDPQRFLYGIGNSILTHLIHCKHMM